MKALAAILCITLTSLAQARPDTDISGVYEVIVGTRDAESAIEYFEQFDFSERARATLTAKQSQQLYAVDSAAEVFRMQNGVIDSHGLLRIIVWENGLGPGVGVAPPETVGQRMAVMRTRDIFRLHDVFYNARASDEPLFVTDPVYDDLYDMTDKGPLNVIQRRKAARPPLLELDFQTVNN